MRISIKRGLDIPISGRPEKEISLQESPKQVSLNLSTFQDLRFKLLAGPGDRVKIGTPLVENKAIQGQMFVSPGSGIVSEIRRGHKRRLLDIVIELSEKEGYEELGPLNVHKANQNEILERFMKGGIFPFIRMRPFNLIANPSLLPRDIFIRAISSRPFEPPPERQVLGSEPFFQIGINALAKLTSGKVHLVHRENADDLFLNAENVVHHQASGPHPIGNSSIHIHFAAPIQHAEDIVWTLNVHDVVLIGRILEEGKYFIERPLSIAGNAVIEEKRGFTQIREGYPVKNLIKGRLIEKPSTLISGDPLFGQKVQEHDFLALSQYTFTAIFEEENREFLHFLRMGRKKYTSYGVYLSGHLPPPKKGYSFTTSQHGEERAFIDGVIYDRVMPMNIPTMALIKAILTEDFDLAERCGLFEVAPEDFDLSTFVCPSKIEMVEIVNLALQRHAREMGY